MEKRGFIGHCECCGKDIYDIPMGDTYYINCASQIFLEKNTLKIDSTYGSSHDMDISFIIDREFFEKVYNKIKNNRYNKYYICDECLDDKTKFTSLEVESLCNINPRNVYKPIPRSCTPIFGHSSQEEIEKELNNFNAFSLPSHYFQFNVIKEDDSYTIFFIENDKNNPKVTDIKLKFDTTLIVFNDLSHILVKTDIFNQLYIPVNEEE